MTLEELYYISQIVAVFAILASLAAVYWQVRQTNMIARADLTQNSNMQGAQLQMSLFDSPEKADLMHRALTGAGPLSDAERARVEVAMSVVFGMHESGFSLRKRDLMEVGAYNGLEALVRLYLRSPHAQGYWKRHRKEGKDAGYVALLDAMVSEIEASQAARKIQSDARP